MQPQHDIATPEPQTLTISVDQILASTSNPRKTFREEGLTELADSIKKFGVLQPILVRPYTPKAAKYKHQMYEIIAGERRWRASKLAEAKTIPARVVEVNDLDMLELQIIENLQREDLHPLEEAESYEALLSAHAGGEQPLSVDDIAAKLGKSRAYIYARMKLCALQPACRDAFYADTLTPSTALLLARIPVPQLQTQALKEITEHWNGLMSYREAQRHIQVNYMLRLDQAKFKIADATLVPAAGACTECAKRTGANPDLFDDVGHADVCTDPMCFADKKAAHAERLRTAALSAGKKVITGKQAKQIKPSQYSSELKGYLDPNDSPWWLDSQKTIKKALGKTLPETVLLEDPHTGEMLELVPEAKTREALKAAGHKLNRASSAQSARDREQERAVKAERAYRRSVLRAVHDAALASTNNSLGLQTIDLQMIADYAFMRLGNESRPVVTEIWGWPTKDLQECRDQVGQLNHAELELLLLDIALASETYVSSWWGGDSEADELEAAAERYNVDTKSIKQALEAESKPAATKTTAKAAPKKAATKQAPAAKQTTKKAAAKRAPAGIKYHNVETGETWSGRGKTPRWLVAAEEAGHIREEFLTQEAAEQLSDTASAAVLPTEQGEPCHQ